MSSRRMTLVELGVLELVDRLLVLEHENDRLLCALAGAFCGSIFAGKSCQLARGHDGIDHVWMSPDSTDVIRWPRYVSAMPIKPLHDNVIISRTTPADRTAGGLHIPEAAKERPIEGKVVAVGPGRRDDRGALIPLEVNAGDLVMFSKYSGTEIDLHGEKVLVMREGDILGIVN